jgi:creatinine amidohydrolase/Fe(II)-dependent formamide hydrolase-like protein
MHSKSRSTPWRPAAALAALLTALSLGAHAQVQPLGSLNTEQLAAVDKSKTVVIIPGGILEEHGPYLPSYTDGYVSERQAQDVADAIVGRGWRVLMFPELPLGSGGANELAAKYPFPGTYAIRLNTLRALYMDIADELGEAGFKWVFILHSHGAPNHNRVLDQACDYFNDTYGGHMVHITGGFGAFGSPDNPRKTLSKQAQDEDAESGHAGIEETSLLLFLRPELVSPDYKNAPARPAAGPNGMTDVAKRSDWTGYFGAPRYSSPEYGARLYHLLTGGMIKEALGMLDSPAKQVSRRARPLRGVDNAAIARDNAIEKRQQDWLKKND